MKCSPFVLGTASGFMCGRGETTCATTGCHRRAVVLCDYPLGGPKAGKTCDRPLCASCRRIQNPPRVLTTTESFRGDARSSDSIDFCPAHADLARKALPSGDITR